LPKNFFSHLFFLLGYAPISINTDGVGSVTIAAHEAVVPFVVRYFPEFPVWEGNPDGAAAQASPVAAALDTVRTYPSVDATVKIAGVSLALAESISPLALKVDLATAALAKS
jgi:hypothetical protein